MLPIDDRSTGKISSFSMLYCKAVQLNVALGSSNTHYKLSIRSINYYCTILNGRSFYYCYLPQQLDQNLQI